MVAIPSSHHLIYSYFLERTGIDELFKFIITNYYVSDDLLKLDSNLDQNLIAWIRLTAQTLAPKSDSLLVQTPEELRLNAYWRLYGLVIPGKEKGFVKSEPHNSQFIARFERILIEIFKIIFDTGITTVKLGDPSRLELELNYLKNEYVSRKFNEMDFIANYWWFIYSRLRAIVEDPTPSSPNLEGVKLFKEKLGIESNGFDQRLIATGEKLKIPIAKQTKSLLFLAESIEDFLQRIVTSNIDLAFAVSEAGKVDHYKRVASAYKEVTEKDIPAETARLRT
jgi:hypothetical protein